MVRVLFNGLASTAGGGITYLRNVLPRLANRAGEYHFRALVPAEHLTEYYHLVGRQIELDTEPSAGLFKRIWWEQTKLRAYLRRHQIEVLVSLGNFALIGAAVPQILFNRNDLHFSREFECDLRVRGLYGHLIANRLKRLLAQWSIKAADVNVAPSKAFAVRLATFNGHLAGDFEVIPFGFDREVFISEDNPLEAAQLDKLRLGEPIKRLLYVSHYNYFRNFETLIRALPQVSAQLKAASGSEVQLVLTTDIRRGEKYGGYDATAASDLIDAIGMRKQIAMLGAVPYGRLHQLYKLCDAFVCPSYSESFGHPLVEAMASGLPVVAADLPVHREVCDDAAIYFDVFNERELAAQCVRVLTDAALAEKLKVAGGEQHKLFSWDKHVEALIATIGYCVRSRRD